MPRIDLIFSIPLRKSDFFRKRNCGPLTLEYAGKQMLGAGSFQAILKNSKT